MRHRFVSLLGVTGVLDAIIPEIVGHADITTSKDTYAHQILDEPRQRLEAIRVAVGRLVALTGVDERERV